MLFNSPPLVDQEIVNIRLTYAKLRVPLLNADGEFAQANSPSAFSVVDYFETNVRVSVEV